VPVAKLLTLIGERAPEAEVLDALDDLKQRALVWVTSSCDWLPTPWPACPGMSDR